MESAPLYLVWLLLHDHGFLAAHARRVDPRLLPQGALRALASLALEHHERTRHPTSEQAVDVLLERGWDPQPHGSDPESMRQVYRDLDAYAVGPEAYDAVVEAVVSWLKLREMGQRIDEAAQALDRGDEEAAGRALHHAGRSALPEVEELDLDDLGLLYQERDEDVTPTGLPFVDKSWRGGPRKHEFGVVLASTSVGKSQTLSYFASNAYKQNRRALYYTFELTPRQVLARIAAAIMRRSVRTVGVDEARRALEVSRVQRGIDRGWVKVRGGMYTVDQLRSDLVDLDREGEKPDIVLLDSADDLHVPRASGDLWQRLQGVFSELRLLAVEQGVVLWTSSQANREAIEKARISLKHINYLSKAQRAHYVLGLAQTEEQKTDPFGPLMNVYILKDSEHGSAGRWAELKVTFGAGDEGFPGFEEKDPDDPTA